MNINEQQIEFIIDRLLENEMFIRKLKDKLAS